MEKCMDDALDPLAPRCPGCGGQQELRWSLRRASGDLTPLRYFTWMCLACGTSWAKPLVLGMRPIIDGVQNRTDR